MKSNIKKRILAAVLCMVMVFSGSGFAMAEDAGMTAENSTEVSQDTGTDATSSGEQTGTETSGTDTGTETETGAGTETGSQTETGTGTETGGEATTPAAEAPAESQGTEGAPAADTEEPVQSPAFEGSYEDDTVEIRVNAEAGIVPEGAELSVTPIEKTEITEDMSEEDKAKAEEINAQYDLTEKKLNEDSEEKEENMEGFLAYDISFLVNGEEVEPSGDVKVVMDFKEAAIPEGVSEDAAVTVKHLKEDETAQDGVVVEDMTAKAEVQTTDKAEVEKVELTTDSFSVYTLQWGKESRTLNVRAVDTNGVDIGTERTIDLEETAEKKVSVIANEFGLSGGYRFIGAYLNGWNSDRNTEIKRLRWNSGNQYNENESGSSGWKGVGTNTIYFVFKSTLPGTIKTENTSSFIELSLFDYVVGKAPDYREYNQATTRPGAIGDNTGINAGHALKFQTNSDGWSKNSINKSGTDGQPNTGIVLPTLTNGFPVLNLSKQDSNGESLAYLFNNTSTDYKSVHTGLNYLFQYDEATRQYSYNSDTNYAYLDAQNNATDFVVYDTPATISDSTKTTQGFFPFSTYQAVNGSVRGPKDGVTLDCNDRQNHYFGMSMRTRFMQPKKGMITENYKMVFSFSGDDDVWVFIDGVLVMDIGGSHGAIAGTIDFTTGEVVVGGKRQGYIGDLLKENGVDDSKLNFGVTESGEKIATLKDYEQFDLDFFYLERGNWDSNCKLEFNLAMINKNSVSVGKEITDVDTSKYEDIEFEYLMEVGDSKNNLTHYSNRKYKIYNLDTRKYTGNTGTTDNNGHFKLKHNQLAVFEEDKAAGTSGINENFYYRVTELNVNSQQYNNVIVNQTDIVSTNYDETVNADGSITGNESNQVYDAVSPEYQVNETGQVIFYNRCSAYNKRELHITKKMQSGQTSGDTFEMQVKLGGELYEGSYFLIKADGTQSQKTASNGIIQLQANQEAVIDDIPADTEFEVVEQMRNLSSDYRSPQYEVTNGGDSAETDGKAAGQTVLGKDTQVIVTNNCAPLTPEEEVPHFKQIDWLGDGDKNPDTDLTGDYYYRLYLDVTGIPTVEPDPADILLILDYSSSMGGTYGSGTRFDGVKKSAVTAVNTLLPKGSKNRIGIIWFDKTADTEEYNVDFTQDKESLLKNISDMKYDEGTNYQSAFYVAQKMLENNTAPGRNQFVIFVTDGYPYAYGIENPQPGLENGKKYAIEQAKEFKGLSGFYAVSVGNETGKEFLKEVVSQTCAEVQDTLEAANEQELETSFQKILGSITRQISNVTITDELSKYVEFVNEQGETLAEQIVQVPTPGGNIALKVTKTSKDGKTVTELNPGTDYSYEINGKTVSVNFGSNYLLEPGAKYTVSFNVKLTDDAFKDSMAGTGDADTDYGNNATSSLQPGHYSNTDATFTYSVEKDGVPTEKTGHYDKPVVQPKGRMHWQLIKESETSEDIKLPGAEFTLVSKDGSTTYNGVSLEDDPATTDVNEKGYIRWTDTTGKIINEEDIPAGEYTLTETVAPVGYKKSSFSWRVTIKNMEAPEICPIQSDGTLGTAYPAKEVEENGVFLYYEFEILNTPNYSLPESGGPGIYWYTIGGMLLMIAGALVLYKNKRREVLER